MGTVPSGSSIFRSTCLAALVSLCAPVRAQSTAPVPPPDAPEMKGEAVASIRGDGTLLINGRPAMWGLEACGTRDLACFAAVGAAVDHQTAIGKDRIASRGRQLAAYLRDRLSGSDWAQLLTPNVPEMSGSISAYHLKGFEELDLYSRYRITAPTGKRDGGLTWMRVSTHFYNGFDQIDRLVDALEECRGTA